MSQALALRQLRQFARADRLIDKAAAYAAKFGAEDVLTATAVQHQALGDFNSGRYASAERRIGHVLAIQARVLDADHPTRAAAFLLLGRIRAAQGKTRATRPSRGQRKQCAQLAARR